MKPILVVYLGLITACFLGAQPLENPIGVPLDRSHWESLRQTMNFDVAPSGKNQQNPEKTNSSAHETSAKEERRLIPEKLQKPLKIVAWIFFSALLLLLAYLSLRYIKLFNLFQQKKVSEQDAFSWVDRIQKESELLAADLSKWLELALEKSDYRMAIRLNYLKILQALAEKNLISWGHNKTNENYIQELQEQVLQSKLTGLTVIFEKIWYGNKIIGKEDYDQLVKSFLIMLKDISGFERAGA